MSATFMVACLTIITFEFYWRFRSDYSLQSLHLYEVYRKGSYGLLLWNENYVKSFPKRFPFYHDYKTFSHDNYYPRFLLKPSSYYKDKKPIFSVNLLGFRSTKDFSINKPQGTIRIVCLGESTTQGITEDGTTYPEQLELTLREAYPDKMIEVINAGISRTHVRDHIEYFKLKLKHLDPDILIYYGGYNSFGLHHFYSGVCEDEVWKRNACWISTLPFPMKWLMVYSAYFRMRGEQLYSSYKPPPTFFQLNADRDLIRRNFSDDLNLLVETVQSEGVEVILSSFVLLRKGSREIKYEEHPSLFKHVNHYNYPLAPSDLRKAFHRLNDQVRKVAVDNRVHFIDLEASFPMEFENFIYDDLHFSARGNIVVANMIKEFFAKRNILENL